MMRPVPRLAVAMVAALAVALTAVSLGLSIARADGIEIVYSSSFTPACDWKGASSIIPNQGAVSTDQYDTGTCMDYSAVQGTWSDWNGTYNISWTQAAGGHAGASGLWGATSVTGQHWIYVPGTGKGWSQAIYTSWP